MFHPTTTTHIEGGNGYAESYCFQIVCNCSNFDFEYSYKQRNGDQLCAVSLSITQNGPEMRITCVPCYVMVDMFTVMLCDG